MMTFLMTSVPQLKVEDLKMS